MGSVTDYTACRFIADLGLPPVKLGAAITLVSETLTDRRRRRHDDRRRLRAVRRHRCGGSWRCCCLGELYCYVVGASGCCAAAADQSFGPALFRRTLTTDCRARPPDTAAAPPPRAGVSAPVPGRAADLVCRRILMLFSPSLRRRALAAPGHRGQVRPFSYVARGAGGSACGLLSSTCAVSQRAASCSGRPGGIPFYLYAHGLSTAGSVLFSPSVDHRLLASSHVAHELAQGVPAKSRLHPTVLCSNRQRGAGYDPHPGAGLRRWRCWR